MIGYTERILSIALTDLIDLYIWVDIKPSCKTEKGKELAEKPVIMFGCEVDGLAVIIQR